MSRPVDLSRHPDALSTLAAREAAIDAETPPIDASTISALSSLSAQLEAATRRLSAHEEPSVSTRRAYTFNGFERHTYPIT